MDDLRPDTEAAQDAAWMRAYAKGDGAAAKALAARYAPKVLAHARRVLNDLAEAEDVTQEAMLRLWRQAPHWQEDGAKLRTWLYRVTANLCTDRLRKRRDVPLDPDFDVADPDASALARLQEMDRAEALQAALMHLPDRQRQAVVLRHIEGLGNDEIAQVMDIGPRAVESLTARGKRALAAMLSGQREELGYSDDR